MLTAKEILTRVDEKYAGCVSYTDVGAVFHWDHGCGEPAIPELTFRTYFLRPSKLRFEWVHDGELNVICSDGITHCCRYSFTDEMGYTDSLESLIAGATGVSMSTAFNVPMLLMPEIRGNAQHLLVTKNPIVNEAESKDGFCCLEGWVERAHDTIMWISSNDFVLHAIREETIMSADEWRRMLEEAHREIGEPVDKDMTYEDSHYFDETRYQTVCFDQPIDPSIFRLNPENEQSA